MSDAGPVQHRRREDELMKVREYIEMLEALPEYLKDSDVLVEWGPGEAPGRVRRKTVAADHFHVFFVNSSVVSHLHNALTKQIHTRLLRERS
jgi:hypothetical protein